MKYVILLFSMLVTLSAQELDTQKKSKTKYDNAFSELDGKGSVITFVNLRDNSVDVVGKVKVDDYEIEIENNKIHLTEEFLTKIGDKDVEFHFTSSKYINTRFKIPVYLGQIYKQIVYVLDKTQPQKVQIVLDWFNERGGYDLDSHLNASNLHVYYRNKSSYGSRGERVSLNRDVRRDDSYELITIDKPSKEEVYRYSVKRYRGDRDWVAKHVTVSVYMDNAMVQQFNLSGMVKTNKSVWNVFKLNSYGSIDALNQLSDSVEF